MPASLGRAPRRASSRDPRVRPTRPRRPAPAPPLPSLIREQARTQRASRPWRRRRGRAGAAQLRQTWAPPPPERDAAAAQSRAGLRFAESWRTALSASSRSARPKATRGGTEARGVRLSPHRLRFPDRAAQPPIARPGAQAPAASPAQGPRRPEGSCECSGLLQSLASPLRLDPRIL